ncbi:MAG: exosortase/archaeosortase family protein [bacterium]
MMKLLFQKLPCCFKGERSLRWGTTFLWGIVATLVFMLYGLGGNVEEVEHIGRSSIRWMILEWNTKSGEYSHGWLVPLVSLAAIWRIRKELVAVPKKVCGYGLGIIGLALLLYWFGIKAQQTRLVLMSLPLLLWGIPVFVFGWSAGRLFIFPCAYLAFCVPLVFIDAVAFPLRLLASSLSEVLLNGVGIPVSRAGTAITSLTGGRFNIDVADPCSGLHSLMAMAALGAAYAYFNHRRALAQWMLFIGSLPIAVAGNVIRVASIAVVATFFGQENAMTFYHDYSGYVMFGAAVLLMMGLGNLIKHYVEKRGIQ